ncbi:hypothetical protein [Pseudotabrizicola algicola]|uniref:Uncharacterized protein n=1 Tax=Pseudotabrizicola algicola TaxID=2709381 RepID=A0A6B3RGW8_9RHOB|nr:hypothetical protein [Pseudotabrizicola algicola]NEX45210.1 hypothetical protein [Pseudotabrizicola algicola]
MTGHDPHAAERSRFARATRATPLPLLTQIIAQTCRAGFGHWQAPAPHCDLAGGPIGRPATHLYEIQLFGQSASGTTPEEAAKNWRTCALNQLGGAAHNKSPDIVSGKPRVMK